MCCNIIILGALAIDNDFHRSASAVHINDLQCTGLESRWQECSFTTSPNQCSSASSAVAAIYCLPNESKWCKMEAINTTNYFVFTGKYILARPSNCTRGELRVDNMGPTEANGRLQICDNSVWFAIFQSYYWTSIFGRDLPEFACQSMGYGTIGMNTT